MKQPDKIWYASYGSNILESRFHCYIAGGKPDGATQTYAGCTDKTLPEDNQEIYINSKVYFAKEAKTWNGGGVAFIKNQFEDDVQSPGRMYLITADQFVDVVRQEIGHQGSLDIDLQQARSDGSLIAKEEAWYGKIIFLGEQQGYPIFTFTNESDLVSEINPPNENYLLTIMRGLRETYNLSNSEIVSYFRNLEGIRNSPVEANLEEILSKLD
jgi:hypothetical protein